MRKPDGRARERGMIMNTKECDSFIRERLEHGRLEMIESIRALVTRESPEIAAAMTSAGEDAFLEPHLFTYFLERDTPIGLPQLVIGSLPPSLRPSGVEVYTDFKGRAYVPKIGYFCTDERCASLVLSCHSQPPGYSLHRGDSAVAFSLEQPWSTAFVPLLRYDDPLLATRFVDIWGTLTSGTEVDGLGECQVSHISNAAQYLAVYCPEYYESLMRVTRGLVVFRQPMTNSFASLNSHGIAFFNVLHDQDEAFFVDEIVHQCGHIVFNSVTTRRADFIAIDPDGPLSALSGNLSDHRKIYDAFHGLFTEYMMSRTLRVLDEARVFSGRQAHEVFGRLSFIARKFKRDLGFYAAPGVFTPLGQEFYKHLVDTCDELQLRRRDLFVTDMTDQPYNFSYALFAIEIRAPQWLKHGS